PAAGRVGDRAKIGEQLRLFPSAEIQFTSSAGDAMRLAQEAARNGFELVIAAGGDGTLNEVINGIAPFVQQLQVGLIPLGTGNDFARMLALPTTVEDCIEVLRAGLVRPIDLIRVT